MNLIIDRLYQNMETMKLNRIKLIFENYAERVEKDKISFLEALDYLIEEEKNYKKENSLEIRTKIAGFPFVKSFEQFDFKFQASIDLQSINDLRTMRFVEAKENVIFLGPPGVGKTHLAISLGLDAIRNNYSCYYMNCHDLITGLNQAQHENRLNQRLKQLCRHKVLIIDEIGYLPIDEQGANLFFQLISKRYEKLSIILTSNKSYSQWNEIFGNTAAAILDRLLHHSTTINIRGESYRIKDKKSQISQIRKTN